MINEIITVGLGGFIGSVLRYLITLIPIKESTPFPMNTFITNILGVILISMLSFYITKNTDYNHSLMLFLKVGLCGGFTTFSTYALEAGNLMKTGNMNIALLYIIATTVLSIIIIFIPDMIYYNV